MTILLKYSQELTDTFCTTLSSTYEGGSLVGDKFSNKNKNSKKSNTKNKKAENHLKLMQGGKERAQTSTTVAGEHKDKKAA